MVSRMERFSPDAFSRAIVRIASGIEASSRPSLGDVTLEVSHIIAALEADVDVSEGGLACPTGQMIALLQEWLHGKYAIDVAYRSFADRVKGPWRDSLVDHWHEHAKEERSHAYDLAMRISGLGGDPAQAVVQIPESTPNLSGFMATLMNMELKSISTGREVCKLSGDSTAFRVMAENIIVVDTQHLDDLRRMGSGITGER